MTRDFARLTGQPFDVVVVGGGIHGLFAAYDAAQRGLRTALVERDDFGSGISFNHQRTIHGGLRALQQGNVRKCLEQIRERRAWARMAPHLLRPLPFLIGTYRGTKRSRTLIRLGFRLYDTLGRRRNDEVLPELHLPKGRLESAAATRRLFPGVSESGLSGGAIWYDYQTVHPDRLTWCVALAADAAGATLVNYAEATAVHDEGGRVTAVTVVDRVTGQQARVDTRAVIVAAGAALPALAPQVGYTAPPFVRAMNLLLDRPARDIALAAPAPSGRMYTLVPWRGLTLVGTWQADDARDDDAGIPDAFLADINAAFPTLNVTRADVRFVHDARVPAVTAGGRLDLLAEPVITRAPGRDGVVVVVGVKYTTARLAAERAVDLVAARRGSRTGWATLPHADVADSEGLIEEVARTRRLTVDRDVLRHLASWYGAEGAEVIRAAADDGQLDRLASDLPVIAGEMTWAARHGAVVHLSDIVFRRTPLASAGLTAAGEPALTRAAALAGNVLGWSVARQADEVEQVRARLPPV